MPGRYPERIICLTDEFTELLYAFGEEDRIVGISGYSVRPPEARKEKPIVTSFIRSRTEKILSLKPDLVLGFSDMQGAMARELIEKGLAVYIFNQRSVQGILDMILTVGSLIGEPGKALSMIESVTGAMDKVREEAKSFVRKPLVYFEEWDDPLITGVRWVSELIEIAGGLDCFTEFSKMPSAKDRILADSSIVIEKNPDIIIGSWCGKKFKPEKLCERPGWDKIKAVMTGDTHEIKSSVILQPGLACLGDGLKSLSGIMKAWHDKL
ncbi:MAG: cobalamin-binding protein [Spirochaetota bacterium]|nr:cobalamin-binding protein [Spirochaetota bacterium]